VSAIAVGGILTLVVPLGAVIVISGWLWLRFRKER
jgi:uncharacterized membrane protein YgdD (TMEM256/DUF423 family)